jgi:hypothetical protein
MQPNMSKLNTAGRINVLSTYPKSIPHLIAEKEWPEAILTSTQSAGGNLTRTDKVFNQLWPETWDHTHFSAQLFIRITLFDMAL